MSSQSKTRGSMPRQSAGGLLKGAGGLILYTAFWHRDVSAGKRCYILRACGSESRAQLEHIANRQAARVQTAFGDAATGRMSLWEPRLLKDQQHAALKSIKSITQLCNKVVIGSCNPAGQETL